MTGDFELWKDIKGYEGRYQASTAGRIRRIFKKGTRLIKTHLKHGTNDPMVTLIGSDGKYNIRRVARVTAETFITIPDGMVVYHLNGNPADNWIGNLGLCMRSELGKMYGSSHRKPVVKINRDGEIVEAYRSAEDAAKANYMGTATVGQYCRGYYIGNGKKKKKHKSVFAPDGYVYAWDDGREIARARQKLRKELNG